MENSVARIDWKDKSYDSVNLHITNVELNQLFNEAFEQALSTIYGVDLMQDNVDLCRERLLCGQEHLRHIVEKNIVCADALRYHYRFDGSPPYDKTPKEKYTEHFNSLISFD